MRRIPFFLFLLLFSFCACDFKPVPSLLGTWETRLTLKTELADGNPDGLAVVLYTKQHITLAFAEGGVYTKNVVQTVDRLESVRADGEAQGAKEYFAQFFNKNLTFGGVYQQARDTVCFVVETVREDDGEALSYEQYFATDPSIGEGELLEAYALNQDGDLLLGGLAYKRID